MLIDYKCVVLLVLAYNSIVINMLYGYLLNIDVATGDVMIHNLGL